MKKLTPAQKVKIVEYCAIYCNEMFVVFSNKENRGLKFTWNSFPETVSRLCEVSVFSIFPYEFAAIDSAERYTKKVALAITNAMITRMENTNE